MSKRQRTRMVLKSFRVVVAVANAVVGLYGAGEIVARVAGLLAGGR